MSEPTDDCPEQAVSDASPDAEPLGATIRGFGASARNRAVIAACGAAMRSAGVFIAFYRPNRPDFIGELLAGWGAVVIYLAFLLGHRRILICQHGIVQIRGRKKESCRWDEISKIIFADVRIRLVTDRRCSLVKGCRPRGARNQAAFPGCFEVIAA